MWFLPEKPKVSLGETDGFSGGTFWETTADMADNCLF